jgi:hypothetical protein
MASAIAPGVLSRKREPLGQSALSVRLRSESPGELLDEHLEKDFELISEGRELPTA